MNVGAACPTRERKRAVPCVGYNKVRFKKKKISTNRKKRENIIRNYMRLVFEIGNSAGVVSHNTR